MDKDIKEKIEFLGLVINRLPSWAKTYIKERSKEEFSGDYGALISYLIRQAGEYEMFKAKFFNSEIGIQLISNQSDTPQEEKVRKSISGEKLNLLGGKNGKDR